MTNRLFDLMNILFVVCVFHTMLCSCSKWYDDHIVYDHNDYFVCHTIVMNAYSTCISACTCLTDWLVNKYGSKNIYDAAGLNRFDFINEYVESFMKWHKKRKKVEHAIEWESLMSIVMRST
jgi:hypothetical protein